MYIRPSIIKTYNANLLTVSSKLLNAAKGKMYVFQCIVAVFSSKVIDLFWKQKIQSLHYATNFKQIFSGLRQMNGEKK